MKTPFEAAIQAYINQGHELKIRKDGTTVSVEIGKNGHLVAAQSLEVIGELMIEGAIHAAHTRIDGGD